MCEEGSEHSHEGHKQKESDDDCCGGTCGCSHESVELTPKQELEMLENYKKQLEQELKLVSETIKEKSKPAIAKKK